MELEGLGDLVALIAEKLGFIACAPCDARRRFLNWLVPFPKKREGVK